MLLTLWEFTETSFEVEPNGVWLDLDHKKILLICEHFFQFTIRSPNPSEVIKRIKNYRHLLPPKRKRKKKKNCIFKYRTMKTLLNLDLARYHIFSLPCSYLSTVSMLKQKIIQINI